MGGSSEGGILTSLSGTFPMSKEHRCTYIQDNEKYYDRRRLNTLRRLSYTKNKSRANFPWTLSSIGSRSKPKVQANSLIYIAK